MESLGVFAGFSVVFAYLLVISYFAAVLALDIER